VDDHSACQGWDALKVVVLRLYVVGRMYGKKSKWNVKGRKKMFVYER